MRRSAFAAAAAALTLTAPAPASAASVAKPRHVAIVIAGHGVACVAWHSGITGDEILNDVATVKYRPTDGLITQIDGTPKNNRADETHYWSYWHNTGNGWTYSTSGANAYQPKAGTVEGWKFVTGSATATPPPSKSYASICHDTVTITAPITSPPRTSATATHSAPATHARPATVHHSAGATRSAASSTSGSSRAQRSSPEARSSASTSTPTPDRVVVPEAAGSRAELPTLHARNTAASRRDADQGSMLPTVVVCVIVGLLGAGAVVATRRRRRQA